MCSSDKRNTYYSPSPLPCRPALGAKAQAKTKAKTIGAGKAVVRPEAKGKAIANSAIGKDADGEAKG